MRENQSHRISADAIRWRRFSKAKYAAFASMHRQVTIGVLSVAMLASADLKAQQVSQSDTTAAQLKADEESTELDAIEVSATRVPLTALTAPRQVMVMTQREIKAAAVHSINDLLEYATGVDVRQRGEMGVQTDISLRGGTFDQITLLLNGINISSPHTGHLAADFPISMDCVERIEILEGPAARVFGTSAFCGAINIITTPQAESSILAHLYGGSYGLVGASVSANVATGKVSQILSGDFKRADGDQPNSDFRQTKFNYQGQYKSESFDLDWQTGVSQQDYGANTFYSAAYPNQWEQTTRWITAVKAETKGRVHFTPSIYWTRSKDHFQLIKDSNKGENYHRTDVYGANLSGWVESKIGKTAFGCEIRNEGIISTNLGRETTDSIQVRGEEIFYKKKDDRTNISYFVEHDILLQKWTISLGAMAYRSSYINSRMKVYPGIDVAFRPSDEWKITASWNQAMRLPTFTDLYYKSPTNEGNVGLKPEETMAFDLGARYRTSGFVASASAFYHKGKNMIDWVMFDPEDIYHSVGFELDNRGLEASFAWLPRELVGDRMPISRISISYAHINQKRHDDIEIYKSNYALEYLRHKLVLNLDTRIVKYLNASIAVRYQDRNGSYILYDANHKSTGELVDYEPYALVDLRLSWDAPQWSIYAEASNLFNREYYDLGKIAQPGIWLKGGAKYRFKLGK